MPAVLLDVTDLVEFLQRQESVSGVQRVIEPEVPDLADEGHGEGPANGEAASGDAAAEGTGETGGDSAEPGASGENGEA